MGGCSCGGTQQSYVLLQEEESGYMFGNLKALNADMKFIYSFFSLLCSDPELMLEIEMTQR